jgi:hypothetical protein
MGNRGTAKEKISSATGLLNDDFVCTLPRLRAWRYHKKIREKRGKERENKKQGTRFHELLSLSRPYVQQFWGEVVAGQQSISTDKIHTHVQAQLTACRRLTITL